MICIFYPGLSLAVIPYKKPLVEDKSLDEIEETCCDTVKISSSGLGKLQWNCYLSSQLYNYDSAYRFYPFLIGEYNKGLLEFNAGSSVAAYVKSDYTSLYITKPPYDKQVLKKSFVSIKN